MPGVGVDVGSASGDRTGLGDGGSGYVAGSSGFGGGRDGAAAAVVFVGAAGDVTRWILDVELDR